MKQIKFFSVVTIAALLAACSCTKGKVSKKDLTQRVWQLQSLNNNTDLSAFSREIPYIKFDEDGRVSGNTGCNNYSGAYNNLTEQGAISFSKVMATKMYCEGIPENEFLKALDETNGIKKEKDELVFLKDNTTVMIFVAKQ